MVFECNIDARGKAVRFKLGMLGVVTGVFLAISLLLVGAGPNALWLLPLGSIVGGAFALFEARTGWCVVRAMGFRTPI
ncbi:MAG: hypothetical protein CMB68_01450 [Euryarchaeota archaeon]|nr:hypothetical protein [Euryarchaeota archaeon]